MITLPPGLENLTETELTELVSTLSSSEMDQLLTHLMGGRGIPDLTLKEFIMQAWPILEPGTQFIDNWHIGAICDHLTSCINGDIRKLVINHPPRTMKSLITSVCWPMWTWTWWPESRWMFSSYAEKLALPLSEKCRVLINSAWYQQRYGRIVKIRADQNAKGRFENTRMGFRMATGVGGAGLGDGGDVICCLPYEATVTTPDGEVRIGQIVEQRLATNVLTYNHETERAEWQPVERFETNPARLLVEIELDDRTLICTEDHPVFVEGKGYVPAAEIRDGDVVLITENPI